MFINIALRHGEVENWIISDCAWETVDSRLCVSDNDVICLQSFGAMNRPKRDLKILGTLFWHQLFVVAVTSKHINSRFARPTSENFVGFNLS